MPVAGSTSSRRLLMTMYRYERTAGTVAATVRGGGGRIEDALAAYRPHRFGHDSVAHDRLASAPLRYDRAIDRGALGGRERKRRRAQRRLIGARLVGRRLLGPP